MFFVVVSLFFFEKSACTFKNYKPFGRSLNMSIAPKYSFITNMQKLSKGIWPWTEGLKSRLPLHYKIRYTETWMKKPEPVHYIPNPKKWEADENGEPRKVINVDIPLTFPLEANNGLWGGEGMIVGLRKREGKYKPLKPKIWKPFLTKRVLYSEILDKYLSITVTLRTLKLIDDNYGLDFYILRTHEVDLKSKLGMKLKRLMLLTLANKSLYPDNLIKREEIYEKYKQFVIPVEEAEWVGLSLQEAERKQHSIEEKKEKESIKPLKYAFAEGLIEEVKKMSLEGEKKKTWKETFNIFKE